MYFSVISITHEIFKGFDANPPLDTCGVFLDIYKAFDKVWHEDLIFKLQSYGITGSLLMDFLSDRLQRVVINGQSSTWESILADFPQGSILGPLLFLIFINDLPLNLESIVKNFADDTSLFSLINKQKSCEDKLNRDLDRISAWAYQWKMSFNPDLTKQATEVYFNRKSDPSDIPTLFFNNIQVFSRNSQKHQGVILDKRLAFDHHLSEKIVKANKGESV